ncbi:hypothetical protein M408DRAFT_328697 [Serendipita vermifera MAFF 305830]|uniref:Pentacotripeptide-repeat region of PRORP domain-containing protein n=1 Tax=Serendipita vermifera MAFF 305830 TaxID=933852 RepID=A0A0C3AXZ9_SERVB|nr:hypothetical protein M408DRAFT_328697 [Serendipita vermifera MAFF 305830]
MLSPCRSTAWKVSNAVASCSYTSSARILAATAAKPQNQRRGHEYADFVKRLSARQERLEGSRATTSDRRDKRNGNTPFSLTVKGLKPYEVAARADVLVQENKLDHAITMVENLPLDAVNVVVWNTLISAAIKEERYKLAFELYYDMKRRHVQPNTRTFTTLFSGLARIEDWTAYSNILQRVFTTYDQLLLHFEKLRIKNPESKDISLWPINSFLTLLGRAHHYSKMWDVFFNLEGRLAPDEHTYAVMLQALQKRTSLDQQPVKSDIEVEGKENRDVLEGRLWGDQFGLDDGPEEQVDLDKDKKDQQAQESVHYRNAADARILWESILKANKLNADAIPLSSYLLAPTLHLLARGRPSDHKLAFDIIAQYVRIQPPSGSTANSALTQQPNAIELNGPTLFSILEVCIQSARPTLAMEYFQQVAEDGKMKRVIDSGHMLYIMRAFAMRRASKGQIHDGREAISALQWMLQELRRSQEGESSRGAAHLAPSTQHFVYALTAAWRGADMSSALAVFELMTGLERTQFMAPLLSSRGDGWPTRPPFDHCHWNVTCMALLVKTAEATQKRDVMRVALRILNTATPDRFFTRAYGKHKDDTILAQRELAMRSIRLLDSLLEQEGGEVEGKIWRSLKRAMTNELARVNNLVVKSWTNEAEEEGFRKAGTVKDGDVQLLVTLKGRKSAWATNL